MRKFIFTLLTIIPVLFLSLTIVSCGSDEEGVTPPSGGQEDESDIALYNFTDENSTYESLEFTDGARYIITRKHETYNTKSRSASKVKFSCFQSSTKSVVTRAPAEKSYIVEGKYRKSDGVYILEGFGSVAIESGNGKVLVTITETGKPATTQNATKSEPSIGASDMTTKACRTWKVDKISYTAIDAKTKEVLYTETATPEEYAKEGDDDAPTQVTFSRYGSYLVKYTDNSLGMARWRWSDETKGILQYSWDFNNTSVNWNSEDSGLATVSFEGDRNAVVTEVYEDGDEIETTITYLTALK